MMDIFYIVALIVLFVWNMNLQAVAKSHYNAMLKLGDIAGSALDSHEHRLKVIEEDQ